MASSSLSIFPLFTPHHPSLSPSCRSSRSTRRTCSSCLCFSNSPASFVPSHPYQSYSYSKEKEEEEKNASDFRVSVYKTASSAAPASASTASNSRIGRKTTAAAETVSSSSSPPPSSTTPTSVSVVFRNLQADDFRHPLDKQNTLLLRTIPGLNELGKALLGPVAEQVMLLENIGTSVLVSENQLPGLHQLMVEAAKILNIEPPDLYVRQNPVPNAYTLAISGRKPFVVIHTSLVELLTRKELQAVLAHELGHLKCDHGVWLTFANILALGAYSIPGLGGLIAQRLEEQLYRWLRAAELTCDRAALLVAQDPKVVISVLMKLAGGCPSLADQLNIDAFLEQARSYDEASSSPVGWYIRNAQTRQLSHPLPVLRAREIDQWSRSREYQSLLWKAMQPSATKKNSF